MPDSTITTTVTAYAPEGFTSIGYNRLIRYVVDLEAQSQTGYLIEGFEKLGPHFFEEIRDDSTLEDYVEELLATVDLEALHLARSVLGEWKKLYIGTQDQFEEWLSSPECAKLRRASCIVAMKLIAFSPLTLDGRMVFLNWSKTEAIGEARARMARNSEWGTSILAGL